MKIFTHLFFYILIIFTSLTYSQTTVDFNSVGLADNTNYGSSNLTTGIYKFSYSAGNWFGRSLGNSGSMGIWAVASFTPTETVTEETTDGSEFDLQSFWVNVDSFTGTQNWTLEGFRNGSSVGTQSTTISGNTSSGSIQTVSPNSTFDNVDKVVITPGTAGYFFDIFDDFNFAAASSGSGLCTPTTGVSTFPIASFTILDGFGTFPKNATVDCWDFEINGPGGSNGTLSQNTGAGANGFVSLFAQNPTDFRFASNDGSEFDLQNYTAQWFTFSGNYTITGYKDGVSVATATGVASSSYTSTDLSANNDFNNIDEFRITGFSGNVTMNLDFVTTDVASVSSGSGTCSFDSNDGGLITSGNFSGQTAGYSLSATGGQSFTACGTGQLNSIGILALAASSGVTISVYDGAGNTGTLLGSVSGLSVSASTLISDRETLDLSSGNINVVSGQTYTFYATTGSISSRITNSSVYSGGIAYDGNTGYSGNDFLFSVDIGASAPSGGGSGLSIGDIAVVGFNGDSNPDDIALVALVDIPTTETFYLTDYPITSAGGSTLDTSNGTNGTVSITPTSTIPAGTIFTVSISGSSGGVAVAGASVSTSFTGWTSTNVAGGGGDSWHIFQGSNFTTPNTFIYAFTNTSSHDLVWDPITNSGSFGSNESYLGNGLTNGTNAVDVGGTAHFDNIYYNGTFSGSKSALLSAITTRTNYTGNNSTVNDIIVDGASVFNGGTVTSNPGFTLTGGNNAPTDITLTPDTVGQSTTGFNATVGTLSTIDADAGDSHTYSLVSGTGDTNNGSFNISGSSLRTSSALTPGSYDIRLRTTDNGTPAESFDKEFTITVTDDVAPAAPSTPDLDAASDTCSSNTDNITDDTTPTFSGTSEANSTVNLFSNINGNIGTTTADGLGGWSITVSTLSLGNHTITATATDAATNTSSSSSGLSLTVTALDNASFSYSSSSYCSDDSDPTPTITGLAGGTFSSTAGLAINASSGAIDVSASTPGTYSVTYTTAGSCPNSSNVSVTINALDDASFNYSASSYNSNGSDPTPTISGLTGGVFSSTSGLSITPSTGLIDVSASSFGTYTVTYTTNGSCINSSTQSITITGRVNDNLANATALTFGASCTGDIYSSSATSLQTGEDVTSCSVPSSNVTGSQWFSFVAPSSGNAIIKFDQNTPAGIIMALYAAPSNLSDLSTLSSPLDCSRESIDYFNSSATVGAFIDAKDLVSGNTYYIQVFSELTTDTSFCLTVEDPVIYSYDNGWGSTNGTPEGVINPYARVEVINGTAVITNAPFNAGTNNLWGNTYVSSGATLEIEALAAYGSFSIDGILNANLSEQSFISFQGKSAKFLEGTGTLNVSNLKPSVFSTGIDLVSDLTTNIYSSLESNVSINSVKTTTFKSTALATAYYSTGPLPDYSLTGELVVEQYYPKTNGLNGRAFRFVGSPVTTSNSIFDNWQESGVSTTGMGTDITGVVGVVGGFEASTGLDYTQRGNPSLFIYSNNTAQAWNAVTTTNQAGDLLNPGEAYRLYIRGDRTLDLNNPGSSNTTTLRMKGSLSHANLTKTYDVEPGQFVMISNPYQNALKMETLIDDSANVTDDILYYWDPTLGGASGQGAYATYTGFNGGGTGMALPSTSANNGFLQPGQGAFIVANGGSAGAGNDVVVNYNAAQLDDSGLINGATTTVTSTASTTFTSIQMELYDTYSLNNGYTSSDALLIRFGDQYQTGIDAHDHMKAFNIDESISIYQNAADYVIASMPSPVAGDAIQLKHYNYGDTEYTYHINVNELHGVNAFLKDNFTGSLTHLDNGFTSVAFNADANDPSSISTDRFEILFQNQTLSIDQTGSSFDFSLYPNPSNGSTVHINSSKLRGKKVTLTLTDLLGKTIFSSDTQFDARGIIALTVQNLPTGVYLVSISDDNVRHTQKLVIK